MTEEEYLHEQLALLRQSYEQAAKPILDRLVRIEQCKPPKPIYIMADQLDKLPEFIVEKLS